MRNMSQAMDINAEWPRIYLGQGECFVSDGTPVVVTTVLGSCVSVTMHCPRLGLGGINHAVLPGKEDLRSSCSREDGCFVRESIESVLQELERRQANRQELQIKVFGGAQTYGAGQQKDWGKNNSVGKKNVRATLDVLQELGLRVMVTEVGGNRGRKLIFLPGQGEVWVKKLAARVAQEG
ncbi:MAG: chemotaxis protein CheD [Desulfohalobiaceae bacterium]